MYTQMPTLVLLYCCFRILFFLLHALTVCSVLSESSWPYVLDKAFISLTLQQGRDS